MEDKYLWVEKYRPKTIEDCILPEETKEHFRGIVKSGRIPNLLLAGSPGTGKTTTARALCEEVGADYILINASNENGIDTFRNKVLQFATTVSLTDAKKVVILDEFENATPNLQLVLRAGVEAVSDNCTFIFTCNYKNKIIEALHSRCMVVDFKINNKEKADLAAKFYKRVVSILKAEEIEFDQKVVAELVTKFFPDYRRTLNELQKYSVVGKIDSGILVNVSEESYKELIKNLKDKNFTEVRKWVAKNYDSGCSDIFRHLYDNSISILDTNSIPQFVLIAADYSYKSAFVADQEINTMAALTEIMSSCRFK